MLRRWAEPLIWLALWLIESMLGRGVQPSLVMALLATGTLTAASASLLSLARARLDRSRNWRLRVAVLVAAVGLGIAAALMIRGLYVLLYPDIRPFSLAFNIPVDIAWVALHALLVGCCLRLLARRN